MDDDRPIIVDLLPLESGLLLAECVDPDGSTSYWLLGSGHAVSA